MEQVQGAVVALPHAWRWFRLGLECVLPAGKIRRLIEDPHEEVKVRAIPQMADSLRLQVAAQGIEDARMLERLIELRCDRGQGFFWRLGLPAMAFSELLKKQISHT